MRAEPDRPAAPLPPELDEFIATLAALLVADYDRRQRIATPPPPDAEPADEAAAS